jgi:hypothetical protein
MHIGVLMIKQAFVYGVLIFTCQSAYSNGWQPFNQEDLLTRKTVRILMNEPTQTQGDVSIQSIGVTCNSELGIPVVVLSSGVPLGLGESTVGQQTWTMDGDVTPAETVHISLGANNKSHGYLDLKNGSQLVMGVITAVNTVSNIESLEYSLKVEGLGGAWGAAVFDVLTGSGSLRDLAADCIEKSPL